MEWYLWQYPEHKYPHSPSGKYVVQILRGIQFWKRDRPKILNSPPWYPPQIRMQALLPWACIILLKVKRRRPPYHQFCWWLHLLLLIQKNILPIHDFIKKYVGVMTQEVKIFKYLNLRIFQGPFSVSFNQIEHICESILDYMLRWLCQRFPYPLANWPWLPT